MYGLSHCFVLSPRIYGTCRMAPTPKSKKQTKERLKMGPKLNYTQEMLERALKAVENGVLTKRAASKTYNIPKTTLLDKLSGRTPRKSTMGHPPYLLKEEEEQIVKWIKDGNKRGLPPHKDDVLDTAQKLIVTGPKRFTPFKNGRPGYFWWQGFLRRHPELAIRVPERVSKSRAAVSESSIRLWFNQLHRNIVDLNLNEVISDPTRIFNVDESNIQLATKTGPVVGIKGQKNCYQVAPGTEKSNLTFVGTFSASGEIIAPTLIYPYKRLPADILQSIPSEFHYLLTDSGWMTSDSFLVYIKDIFITWLNKNNIKRPVLLYVDGHRTHVTLQVSVLCEENDIVLYLLPPNTTHLLQPADVGPFRPLKAFWSKEVHNKQQLDPGQNIKRRDVAPMLKNVLEKIKKESIINGFKRTGLYPLNVESVDFSKIVEVNYVEEPSVNEKESNIKTKSSRTPSEYRLCCEIFEEEIGFDKIEENMQERTTMSKDLYELYRRIKDKGQQLVGSQEDLTSPRNDTNSLHNLEAIYNEGPVIVVDNLEELRMKTTEESNLNKPSCSYINDSPNIIDIVDCNSYDIQMIIGDKYTLSLNESQNSISSNLDEDHFQIINESNAETLPSDNVSKTSVEEALNHESCLEVPCTKVQSNFYIHDKESHNVNMSDEVDSKNASKTTKDDETPADSNDDDVCLNEQEIDGSSGKDSNLAIVSPKNEVTSTESLKFKRSDNTVCINSISNSFLDKDLMNNINDLKTPPRNGSFKNYDLDETLPYNSESDESPKISNQSEVPPITRVRRVYKPKPIPFILNNLNESVKLLNSNLNFETSTDNIKQATDDEVSIKIQTLKNTDNETNAEEALKSFKVCKSSSAIEKDERINWSLLDQILEKRRCANEMSNTNLIISDTDVLEKDIDHDEQSIEKDYDDPDTLCNDVLSKDPCISKENILEAPIVTIIKKPVKESVDVVSIKKYRKSVIEKKSKRKRKDDDWQCMYCQRLWSQDKKENKDSLWVECDTCQRELHIKCAPTKHLRSIEYQPPLDSDEEEEIDFKCELCYVPN